MNLLNSHSLLTHFQPIFISFSSLPRKLSLSPPLCFISKTPQAFHLQNAFSPTTTISFSPLCSSSKREFRKNPRVSDREALIWSSGEGDDTDGSMEFEDIATDGVVYKKTLRLVECSMFAAVTGLAYFLSNSLAIENYFGCFFSLPIVISSLRWDLAAGRKTMVATSMLLLTLSGPVKAATYLVNTLGTPSALSTKYVAFILIFLMHGLVGLAMGSLWRLGANWGLSIAACTLVRAVGLMGYVLISSFLIRENILALITANLHASLSYVLTAIGVNTIPSMTLIYSIFGMVLLLNCVFFVLLLHILYAVFLARLGMKASLTLPRWLKMAI